MGHKLPNFAVENIILIRNSRVLRLPFFRIERQGDTSFRIFGRKDFSDPKWWLHCPPTYPGKREENFDPTYMVRASNPYLCLWSTIVREETEGGAEGAKTGRWADRRLERWSEFPLEQHNAMVHNRVEVSFFSCWVILTDVSYTDVISTVPTSVPRPITFFRFNSEYMI